jgi:hypothetical protein
MQGQGNAIDCAEQNDSTEANLQIRVCSSTSTASVPGDNVIAVVFQSGQMRLSGTRSQGAYSAQMIASAPTTRPVLNLNGLVEKRLMDWIGEII